MYLASALALGIGGRILMYIVQARGTKRHSKKRPWHRYLLLWPIVLDADKEKRDGRFLTNREWLGWGIVVLIVVLAVTFT
jgi:hypothetical protein